MTRRLRYILLILLLSPGWLPAEARTESILVVQDAAIQPFQTVAQGLQDTLSSQYSSNGFKKITSYELDSLVLGNEQDSPDTALHRQIVRKKPDLIVTMGKKSLQVVAAFQDIPVIYLMAPKPAADFHPQLTGIDFEIPAARQLELFRKAIPHLKNIGLLIRDDFRPGFMEAARTAAAAKNMTLVPLAISSPREIPEVLKSLPPTIDGLWLLADPVLLNRYTLEVLARYSMHYRKPLLTFTDRLLDYGATVGVSLDLEDMGRQAGEIALEILAGTNAGSIVSAPIRKFDALMNKQAADMLAIQNVSPFTSRQ